MSLQSFINYCTCFYSPRMTDAPYPLYRDGDYKKPLTLAHIREAAKAGLNSEWQGDSFDREQVRMYLEERYNYIEHPSITSKRTKIEIDISEQA